VLTFVLDGKASLPPPPPPFKVRPVADSAYREDVALTAKGLEVFNKHCITCHGWQAIAGGVGPDLRGSTVPLTPEGFDSVVRGGALVGAGMPEFDEVSDQEMIALRQYIRSRAADLRAGRLWPKGGSGFTSYTHGD
jgi:quinohemoprotein ethanol dehydrogenase